MRNNKGKKRLFLALWPDDPVRQQLNSILGKLNEQSFNGSSAVSQENLHMTLLFLGDVHESEMVDLISSLENISVLPFTLSIDRWGHFHKPGILWLGITEIPDQLNQLFKQIKAIVAKHIKGVPLKKFKPHITMLRKAKSLPQVHDFEPIEWQINSFVLVESILRSEGVEYKVLQEW